MAVPDSKDRTVVVECMTHPGDPFSLLPVVEAFEDDFFTSVERQHELNFLLDPRSTEMLLDIKCFRLISFASSEWPLPL
jgi:hypothetical protein